MKGESHPIPDIRRHWAPPDCHHRIYTHRMASPPSPAPLRSSPPAEPGGLPAVGSGDKSPFFFPQPGTRAVLCLHGFTGTPFEVRPLGESLAARGFTASGPLLAGHGTSVGDLCKTGHAEWQASAERALLDLVAKVEGPVAIAGFSMGGLLALRLARAHPDKVKTLAVMAAPLRLRPFQVSSIRALMKAPAFLRKRAFYAIPKAGGFDVVDPAAARANPALRAMPICGVASLIELGRLVAADLPAITCPTLIMHGARDRTVPLEDSFELAGRIGATTIERVWLPRSGHLLCLDVERRLAAQAVIEFFLKHLPPEEPARANRAPSPPSPKESKSR